MTPHILSLPTGLPSPAPEAAMHSGRVLEAIVAAVSAAGGWLPFERYMELCLYAPGLGYYSSGAAKFGAPGDFVTAPGMSPLFGATVARAIRPALAQTWGDLMELGPGDGSLVRDVLLALAEADSLPPRVLLLDLSADLRERQQAAIAALPSALAARVEWLDRMPESFTGVVLANEVFDALPVHLVALGADGPLERGVVWRDGALQWETRPILDPGLARTVIEVVPGPDYVTEVCPLARALMTSLARMIGRGMLLVMDYGFPAWEYYHPQRSAGTLMCHHRHRAHDDPLVLPGLQDITAHVDFTALAEAARDGGLDLIGYGTQAAFLIGSGVLDILALTPADDAARYLPLAAQVQRLLSPAEMGELFKVAAYGRGMATGPAGLAPGNRVLR